MTSFYFNMAFKIDCKSFDWLAVKNGSFLRFSDFKVAIFTLNSYCVILKLTILYLNNFKMILKLFKNILKLYKTILKLLKTILKLLKRF